VAASGLGLGSCSSTRGSPSARSCRTSSHRRPCPILAIAPLVVVALKADWLSVMAVATYLTFFPVTIASLRGLRAFDPRALELFRSYAATRRQTLVRLRLPTSVPYLFSGFRVAAAASVIGAIIGEQTAGVASGLGSAIINYSQYYTSGPEKLWATLVMCTLVGFVFVGLVNLAERILTRGRYRPWRGSCDDTRSGTAHGGRGVLGRRRRPRRSSRPSASARSSVEGAGSVTALEAIDLTIRQGEFVSLIGPSGCGKSTFLRIIGDLTTPTSGTISINGKPAARARLDRDYGMVFQAPVLMDWRTIAKNIELPLEIMGYAADDRRRRSQELLELVELGQFADRHPWQLSGGMQQRVAIARAPVVRPEAPADGRAVRRAGRDDPRADERRAHADLAPDRHDDRLRHAQHPRGGLPLDPGRRDVARPGRISQVVDIDLPEERSVETRESEAYFRLVTRVREALRRDEPTDGTGGPLGPDGEAPSTTDAERVRAEGLT
jgi:NitT/TauT family transport system ATP-binding protein